MRGADTQDPVLVSHRSQHGTEVMVKNVPVKCGQRRLLRQFLGAGFQGKLDRLSDHFMSSGGVGALISKVISISGQAGLPHQIILQSFCKTYLGELTYRRCGAASKTQASTYARSCDDDQLTRLGGLRAGWAEADKELPNHCPQKI